MKNIQVFIAENLEELDTKKEGFGYFLMVFLGFSRVFLWFCGTLGN